MQLYNIYNKSELGSMPDIHDTVDIYINYQCSIEDLNDILKKRQSYLTSVHIKSIFDQNTIEQWYEQLDPELDAWFDIWIGPKLMMKYKK